MDADGGLAADVVTGATYLGFFEGALYGPQANEVGGTFGFVSTQLFPWDAGLSVQDQSHGRDRRQALGGGPVPFRAGPALLSGPAPVPSGRIHPSGLKMRQKH